MGLGDVYLSNVKKTSIGMSGMTDGIPSTRERDPKSIELENNVLSQMQQAAVIAHKPKEEKTKIVNTLQPIGLEQAMKELLNGTESFDDKL